MELERSSSWPDRASFWKGKRVLVTGGAGFLGSHLVEKLQAAGPAELLLPELPEHDLTSRKGTYCVLEGTRPDLVFHLAARVGGIGANRDNPGLFAHDNLEMGVHLIEGCRRAGVAKTVVVGTICAYPKHTPVPFREENLWDGYPEETNAPYGLAKKMLLVLLQAYREQYGMNGIFLLPVNLYGPRDNFDLETSHVIPAMIRKFAEAKEAGEEKVVLWGDGSPTREFFYVDDCAEALMLAAERYDGPEPVNIGSGNEISIRDLAETIRELTGFSGRVEWDTTKPNGQPRRCLDVSRAREWFGFEARMSFAEGLRRTYEWYEAAEGRRPRSLATGGQGKVKG